jgi:hypothetical protein
MFDGCPEPPTACFSVELGAIYCCAGHSEVMAQVSEVMAQGLRLAGVSFVMARYRMLALRDGFREQWDYVAEVTGV